MEREIEREIKAELALDDPTLSRLRLVYFVSKSKGRNRPRRVWTEIELIADVARPERPLAYQLATTFPWDDVSKELYPFLDGYTAERKARRTLGVQSC